MNKLIFFFGLIFFYSVVTSAQENLKFRLIEKPHWGPATSVTVELSKNKLWINGSKTATSVIPSLAPAMRFLTNMKLNISPGCSGPIIQIEKVTGTKKTEQLGCLIQSLQADYRQALAEINALSEREKRIRAAE